MGLLVPSVWAVMCRAKPFEVYLLADFIKRYKNKLILLYMSIRSGQQHPSKIVTQIIYMVRKLAFMILRYSGLNPHLSMIAKHTPY